MMIVSEQRISAMIFIQLLFVDKYITDMNSKNLCLLFYSQDRALGERGEKKKYVHNTLIS